MIFADAAFRKAAIAALGVEEIENEEQLAEIDALDVTGAHTLDDLSRFSALTWLGLTKCKFKNAQPLRQMRGLHSLRLNHVSGVTAQDIAPLTGLVCLWINNCGEWDIAPLATLIRLKDLTLWHAGIRDLSPLKDRMCMVDLSMDYIRLKICRPCVG